MPLIPLHVQGCTVLAMDLMENGSLWMGLTRKGKDGKPLFQWNQRSGPHLSADCCAHLERGCQALMSVLEQHALNLDFPHGWQNLPSYALYYRVASPS